MKSNWKAIWLLPPLLLLGCGSKDCVSFCKDAAQCEGAGVASDNDLAKCENDCNERLDDTIEKDCLDVYMGVFDCINACDTDAKFQDCAEVYVAYDECLKTLH